MNRLLADLYDRRIEHLASCEVCAPRAWLEGGELCDEGEAIRRRIEEALSSTPGGEIGAPPVAGHARHRERGPQSRPESGSGVVEPPQAGPRLVEALETAERKKTTANSTRGSTGADS
jgi:hypothetical protein